MKKADMTLIFLFIALVYTSLFKYNLFISTTLLLTLGLALFFRESEVSIVLRVLLCLCLVGMMVLATRAHLYG